MANNKVIIVEGIIGVGKTTLARELAESLNSKSENPNKQTLLLEEPDEREDGNPYLKPYYEDPERWAFTLQAHMLARRFRMQLQAQWHVMNRSGHAVLDRSYQGDTCFAKMLVKDNVLNEQEFETYRLLYQAMTASVLLPQICIRLMTQPSTALARINERLSEREGRKCESGISLDYLKNLDAEVTEMCQTLGSQGVRVIELIWDEPRRTRDERKPVIDLLAEEVLNTEPNDLFTQHHKRVIG